MLDEISINGLGVIDTATVNFPAGLTVLTGETGAGKTMVVTSLRLLSGGRADSDRVRTGADRATVEGRFVLDGRADVAQMLESAGAQQDDDDSVIAVRTVGADGRSRAHLGGRSVPVGVLGEFTNSLLAIHGQNDQLRLLKPEHQREALDRFAGSKIDKPLRAYQAARRTWIELSDQLTERRNNSRALAQEADQLRFALGEIEVIDPAPGEDVEIASTISRLGDLEAVRTAAAESHGLLTGGDVVDSGSVRDGLGTVRSILESTSDSALRGLLDRVEEALTIVTDIGGELGSILSDLPADASELEKLMARQAELKTLLRKYAPDIDGVIAYADGARARLAQIDDPSASLDELAARVDAARAEVTAAAAALTAVRVKAAASLSTTVTKELSGLAMGDSKLSVTVRPEPATGDDRRAIEVDGVAVHASSTGVDRVEFALAAHDGAPALPIAKSASGGELSRVMLALEVVLADPAGGSTMVFDEVDAGVGGRAAVEIGRRLARLARAHQVIVVTHLPQVAAFADHHLLIGKARHHSDKAGKRTVTSTVTPLVGDDRVAELARMLAGLGDSDTGRAHAEELLETAGQEKSA